MSDVLIRKTGRAGRITLNRPSALNAVTYQMCLEIEAALDDWQTDDAVSLVVIDAVGDKAFSAGGDLAEMYRTGAAGDFAYGRTFWIDEYRLNAKIAEYPKPYVAFMQGFTMGGGVGVSCHGSHRIVGDSSQISMPECGVGLIPDVGGSRLLADAPGRLGEYVGTTGFRMGPGDAILMGFADSYIPEDAWPALIAALEATGDVAALSEAVKPTPLGELSGQLDFAERHFRGQGIGDVIRSLEADGSELAAKTLKALSRQSPLSVACAYEVIGRVRALAGIRPALGMEYRYTFRAMEHGDFIEGIRAAIIDKDRNPDWRHTSAAAVPAADVTRMLMPLGPDALRLPHQGEMIGETG